MFNLYDIGLFNNRHVSVRVVESAEQLFVSFLYAGEHIELPDGYNGSLETTSVETLDLFLPKTVYSYNGKAFNPVDYLRGLHIETNNGGSHNLRGVAERLYVWSKWGTRRSLVPDPVLEDAQCYGALVEHLIALDELLCKEQ